MTNRWRVLVVDDDACVRKTLGLALEEIADVTLAHDAEAALAALAGAPFDAVLTDFQMPGRSGLWLLAQVRAAYPTVRRLLMSGHFAREPDGEAVEAFLSKPFGMVDVRAALEELDAR